MRGAPYRVVDRNKFELPSNCPFKRSKDMYLEHESNKQVVRQGGH